MKTKFLFFLLLITVSSCTDPGRKFHQQFRLLDKAIEKSDSVDSESKRAISVITAAFNSSDDIDRKRELCLQLIDKYGNFSVDSLSKYASVYSSLAHTRDEKAVAAIQQSLIAQIKEDFVSCTGICGRIDTASLSRPVLLKYLRHWESVNYSMFIRAFNSKSGVYLNHAAGYYRENLRAIRGHILSIDSTSYKAILCKASELRDDKLYERALEILDGNRELFTTDQQLSQYWRYHAVIYDFLDMEDKQIPALIQSEIHNFNMPTYDHLSLISLSKILARHGDLERAVRYVSIAHGYSLKSKNAARMANAGKASQRILAQVDEARHKTQMNLHIAFSFVIIICIFLILAMLRISRTQVALYETNNRLAEADLIKNNCIFKYMGLSAEYLRNADEYHKELRRIAKSDEQMLLARLRLPSPFESAQKDFLKSYDRNFLSLFPEFVRNVNSLMKEGSGYVLNQDGTMPVELRVLSVVRLGMTDSRQISKFLQYSIATVYTYRCRAADKSRFNRKTFEKKLLECPLKS